jgi:ABC-type uncharacterized transport system substrate-binding protein
VIDRRAFLASLAAASLSAPERARAQQPPKARGPYKIGILIYSYGPNPPVVQAFKAGLAEQGFEEGRDIAYQTVFTRASVEALPGAAASLVREKVDVIFTTLETPTRAAMAATKRIPIVFVQVGDPVAAGLVSSIARPGGHITGVSGLTTELAPKRLEALKSCAPALKRVWAIHSPDDRSSAASAKKAREAAPTLSLEILDRPVRSDDEAVSVLKTVPRADGILAPTAITFGITGRVLDLAPFVPSVFDAPHWVQGGGLVAYGVGHDIQGRQAARLVARILRGSRPRDLPVESSTKFELAINLKTAKALHLTIPPSLLARADQVIQ